MAPRTPMTVPPVVFNERLAKRLRTLDSGAQALAVATKGLTERLDEHEAKIQPKIFHGMKGQVP
ncbi:MAG TPA: hypothetical protein VF077_09545 [Nitrospiraceae bacterium]